VERIFEADRDRGVGCGIAARVWRLVGAGLGMAVQAGGRMAAKSEYGAGWGIQLPFGFGFRSLRLAALV
jgi:hypothetical protein